MQSFRIVDNPEISFIDIPETDPLKVALLQIKFPETSTENVLLVFFRTPVYWGELILSFVPICNNIDAVEFCSDVDRLFSAAANSDNVSKLVGAWSFKLKIMVSTSDLE